MKRVLRWAAGLVVVLLVLAGTVVWFGWWLVQDEGAQRRFFEAELSDLFGQPVRIERIHTELLGSGTLENVRIGPPDALWARASQVDVQYTGNLWKRRISLVHVRIQGFDGVFGPDRLRAFTQHQRLRRERRRGKPKRVHIGAETISAEVSSVVWSSTSGTWQIGPAVVQYASAGSPKQFRLHVKLPADATVHFRGTHFAQLLVGLRGEGDYATTGTRAGTATGTVGLRFLEVEHANTSSATGIALLTGLIGKPAHCTFSASHQGKDVLFPKLVADIPGQLHLPLRIHISPSESTRTLVLETNPGDAPWMRIDLLTHPLIERWAQRHILRMEQGTLRIPDAQTGMRWRWEGRCIVEATDEKAPLPWARYAGLLAEVSGTLAPHRVELAGTATLAQATAVVPAGTGSVRVRAVEEHLHNVQADFFFRKTPGHDAFRLDTRAQRRYDALPVWVQLERENDPHVWQVRAELGSALQGNAQVELSQAGVVLRTLSMQGNPAQLLAHHLLEIDSGTTAQYLVDSPVALSAGEVVWERGVRLLARPLVCTIPGTATARGSLAVRMDDGTTRWSVELQNLSCNLERTIRLWPTVPDSAVRGQGQVDVSGSLIFDHSRPPQGGGLVVIHDAQVQHATLSVFGLRGRIPWSLGPTAVRPGSLTAQRLRISGIEFAPFGCAARIVGATAHIDAVTATLFGAAIESSGAAWRTREGWAYDFRSRANALPVPGVVSLINLVFATGLDNRAASLVSVTRHDWKTPQGKPRYVMDLYATRATLGWLGDWMYQGLMNVVVPFAADAGELAHRRLQGILGGPAQLEPAAIIPAATEAQPVLPR